MACHTANMAFRALKLDAPIAVVAEAGEINPETFPAWAHIQYIFPARGDMPACTLHWYEGKRDGKTVLPPEELLAKLLKKGEKLADSGSILVGDKGVLFSPNDYGAQFRLTPEKDFAGVQTTKPEKLPEGVDTGQRPAHEEGVGGRDQGRQAGAGVVELRLRRAADGDDAAGQHRRPVRRARSWSGTRPSCGSPTPTRRRSW